MFQLIDYNQPLAIFIKLGRENWTLQLENDCRNNMFCSSFLECPTFLMLMETVIFCSTYFNFVFMVYDQHYLDDFCHLINRGNCKVSQHKG